MNKEELVKELRSDVFRTPKDLLDAWDRVVSIADSSRDKASVWLAVREFANAVANEIERSSEEAEQDQIDHDRWVQEQIAEGV